MPARYWDAAAHNRLLLMIVSQHPSILSKVDADAITRSWPGAEPLTVRAVEEQIKTFRKKLKSGDYGAAGGGGAAPTTPSRAVVSAPNPKSNSKPKTSTPSVTPLKRTITTSTRTPPSSAKKRRITPRKRDSDESSEPELSSEEEEDPQADAGADETDDDAPLAEVQISSERRTLPARSRSRSKSYVNAESDSEGRDAGARETDSGGDSEFSLSKVDEGKKGRGAGGTLLRRMMAAKEGQDCDGGKGEGGEVEGYGCEDGKVQRESDAESGTTRRTSWKSALEEI